MRESSEHPYSEEINFGHFRLFVGRKLLMNGERRVQLGGRAFDILIALVQRAGQLVEKDELIRLTWPDTFVDESNLRVNIAALRRALGDGQGDNRYIVNLAGRGYSFVAPIERNVESAPEANRPLVRSARVHNLPTLLTRIVGREEAVAAVAEQLPRRRFVSIVGSGGIGKTTVALAVGERLTDAYEDGICFVDLSPVADQGLAASALASSLGLPILTGDAIPVIIGLLAEQQKLIVLDTCEHLIQAAAQLAEALLKDCSGVHILTTTREPLRAEGEHVYRLSALATPPVGAGLAAERAREFASVRLFCERAASSFDTFELDNESAPAVGDICAQLDGLPLAIEIAAGHIGALGLQGLSQAIAGTFLIARGRRTAFPRHQTLRAMLDWSYELLPEAERKMFRRLSVLVGRYTIEACINICADEGSNKADVIVSLASLVIKSLVSADISGPIAHYRILDITRAYAAMKLEEAAETDFIARRHAAFFSKFLMHDEIVQSRFGERDLSGYALHLGNVRAGLEWAFSNSGDEAVGVELAAAAAPLFVGLSLLLECRGWCERALTALGGVDHDDRLELILQEGLALASMYTRGHSEQVRAAIDRGLALAESLGDRVRQLQLLAGLNLFLNRLGDHGGSMAAAEKASAVAEAITDRAGLVWSEWMFGISDYLGGSQADAQLHLERGLELAQEMGVENVTFFGSDHRIRALLALARVLWLRGFGDQALVTAQKTIDEAASQGKAVSICVSLMYCAPVFVWTGDLPKATDYVEQLITYARRYSLEPYRASGLALKGVIAIARGDAAIGLDLLRGALKSLQAEQYRVLLTTFIRAVSEGLLRTGQFEEALATADEATSLATSSGITFDIPELLRIKSEILVAKRDREAAKICLIEAISVARSQAALSLELRAAMGLARLLSDDGQHEQARHGLALVYHRFVEGFETSDLRHARLLLEELEAPPVGSP